MQFLFRPPARTAALYLALVFLLLPVRSREQSKDPTASPLPTVVDLPATDLLQRYPEELKGVDFVEDQSGLAGLLKDTGESVSVFLKTLPNTVSRERIRQERLTSGGRVEDHVQQDVSYLLLLRWADDRLDWEEARTDSRGKNIEIKKMQGTSLVTSGYAMECILLSPHQQRTSRFRYLGRQSSEPCFHVILFAQRPGLAVPGILHIKGMEVPFLSQGIVWVDPVSHQVVRIRSDILQPLPDFGLVAHSTQISYTEHHFSSNPGSFWLPDEVVVTIGFGGRTYRNIHRYSDYKLFSVESFEKTEPIQRGKVTK